MAPITGTYTQVSSEKYEEFLKALGVGFILRKAALASTPVMTISEDGGNWTMVTKTTVKSIELKFRSVKGQNLYKIRVKIWYLRIGEEFEEDTTDGRHCKTIVTLEGNTMTTTQNATKAGEKNVVVVSGWLVVIFSDWKISIVFHLLFLAWLTTFIWLSSF